MLKITIPGEPRTKKNSSQLIRRPNGRTYILPSKAYREYEEKAGWFIPCRGEMIDYPVNLAGRYYMGTRRKVDLANLLEATCDILTRYKVLADDNSGIVASHDGSGVFYDKENPRAEIEITKIGGTGKHSEED